MNAIREGLWDDINEWTAHMHAGITVTTPIDTGRARRSWQTEVGESSSFSVPEEGTYPAEEQLHIKESTREKLRLYPPSKLNDDWKRTIGSSLDYMFDLVYNNKSQQTQPGWFESEIGDATRRFEADLKDD